MSRIFFSIPSEYLEPIRRGCYHVADPSYYGRSALVPRKISEPCYTPATSPMSGDQIRSNDFARDYFSHPVGRQFPYARYYIHQNLPNRFYCDFTCRQIAKRLRSAVGRIVVADFP